MSNMKNGTLDNYWGMSGSMEMLSFDLDSVAQERHRDLRDIFKRIADTEEFSQDFQEFVSFQLIFLL